MMINFTKKIGILCLVLTFSACGKRALDSPTDKNTGPRLEEDGRVERDDILVKSQRVVCEDEKNCPDYIAKLVIFNKSKISHCTGTLISKNEMVTSASCVSKYTRIPRLKCDKNIFIVFPKTKFSPAEIKTCDRIVYVDSNEIKEPALWRNDLLVIKLKSDVYRRSIPLTRNGVEDLSKIKLWKIDYKTSSMATLTSTECTVMHNSYLNPYAKDKNAPMSAISDCHLKDGNLGAPLIQFGRVVGIYSAKIGSRVLGYLRNLGVLDLSGNNYYHFSNAACSGFSHRSLPPILPRECTKPITSKKLKNLRTQIIRGRAVHKEIMSDVLAVYRKPDMYFLWNAKFIQNAKSNEFISKMTEPRCIYRVRDWIHQYKNGRKIKGKAKIKVIMPHYVLRTKLDKYLKPYSLAEDLGGKEYTVRFNPFTSKVKGWSKVVISTKENKKTRKVEYDKITTECPKG